MPRAARKRSGTGLYHVVARGVARQPIFEDARDYERMIGTMAARLRRTSVELDVYCLMGNHYHLLLFDPASEMSSFMAGVNTSYAMYYNARHGRVGTLFQERFWSEGLEDEVRYLTVVRYILQNPERAGIAAARDYPWSSMGAYAGPDAGIVSTRRVLEVAGGLRALVGIVEDPAADGPGEPAPAGVAAVVPEALATLFDEEFGVSARMVPLLARPRRDAALRRARESGFSVRAISQATGLGRGVVQRA